MSDLKQLFESIKKELEAVSPSRKAITSYLLSISKEDFGLDYFDLVGSTFQLNPEFFMKSVYPSFRKKLAKFMGDQKIREMERFILEKFCLYQGEEILYERTGSIQELLPKSYKILVLYGTIYITTSRIIAQGRIRTVRLSSSGLLETTLGIIDLDIPSRSRAQKRRDIKPKNAKEGLISVSVLQELPCYGYIFPIKRIFNLRYSNRRVTYEIIHAFRLYKYKLSFSSSKTPYSYETLVNILKNNKRETFSNKSFRFKGRFKSEIKILSLDYIKDLVKSLGGKINDTSAKTLSYLITNKPKSMFIKFQEKGTEILTEEEFLELLEG